MVMNASPKARGRWIGNLGALLLAAAVGLIAVCAVAPAALVLQRAEQRSERTLLDQQSDQATRQAARLEQRIVALQAQLRAAASLLPPEAASDAAAAAQFLSGQPGLLATFATLAVADAAGQVLALDDGTTVSQPAPGLAGLDAVRQTLSGRLPLVSAAPADPGSGEAAVTLTMPVFDLQGRVVAVLGGTLRGASLDLLSDLAQRAPPGQPATRTMVLDARGTILPQPGRVRAPAAVAGEPQAAAALARLAAAGPPGPAVAVHEGGQFIAAAEVPAAGWKILSLTADGALVGAQAQARREAAAWAGGVAAAGAGLMGLVVVLLTRPLLRLRQRALRLHDDTIAFDEGWPAASGEVGELGLALQGAVLDRVEAEEAARSLRQQLDAVLAATPVRIAIARGQRFERVSAEFSTLLGWPEGALAGRPTSEIFATGSGPEAVALQLAVSPAAGRSTELALVRRDGSTCKGRLRVWAIDPSEPAEGAIWWLEEPSAGRDARATWSAGHDTLTRLLSRSAFEERLLEWVRRPRAGVPACLLFIDLDQFRLVNDYVGHAAGDAVLREVAAVLQAQVRSGDAAARLGGDEFALLLPGCVAPVALQIAERLRSAIARIGVDAPSGRAAVSASVGVVEIDPASTEPAGAWLVRADAACHEAKRAAADALRPGRSGAALEAAAAGVPRG
jgi:diguanylate cyclase (GGDEF)-like protein